MLNESNPPQSVQTKDEEVKEKYVNWKNRKIKIPNLEYRPGGVSCKYNSKTVETTLNFYYNKLICGDITDALIEEHEDGHDPYLFNAVLPVAIKDCEGNLAKSLRRLYLQRLLKEKK